MSVTTINMLKYSYCMLFFALFCTKPPANLLLHSLLNLDSKTKSKAAGGEKGEGGWAKAVVPASCNQIFNKLHTPPLPPSGVTHALVPSQNEIGDRGTLGGRPGDIRII